ncbi:hypothetical protein C8R45DRAFT_1068599 [Mycena sanguinolenta]|nr:hypothetical protein C8R45DRAFT_1068599 [Mycena sanguinolenta]
MARTSCRITEACLSAVIDRMLEVSSSSQQGRWGKAEHREYAEELPDPEHANIGDTGGVGIELYNLARSRPCKTPRGRERLFSPAFAAIGVPHDPVGGIGVKIIKFPEVPIAQHYMNLPSAPATCHLDPIRGITRDEDEIHILPRINADNEATDWLNKSIEFETMKAGRKETTTSHRSRIINARAHFATLMAGFSRSGRDLPPPRRSTIFSILRPEETPRVGAVTRGLRRIRRERQENATAIYLKRSTNGEPYKDFLDTFEMAYTKTTRSQLLQRLQFVNRISRILTMRLVKWVSVLPAAVEQVPELCVDEILDKGGSLA